MIGSGIGAPSLTVNQGRAEISQPASANGTHETGGKSADAACRIRQWHAVECTVVHEFGGD